MGKKALQLDWTIAEDEQMWHALLPARPPLSPAAAGTCLQNAGQAETRLAALVVLVGLIVAALWMLQRQSAQDIYADQLQMAVSRDINAQLHASTEGAQHKKLLSSSIGPIVPVHSKLPEVQIDDFEQAGDRAMARVTVTYPDTEGAYRETRFFRQTSGQWKRIEPDPDLLGPWQTMETAHFLMRYRAVDAAAVAQVAPRLDRLYTQLRQDVGIPAASALSTVSVIVNGMEPEDAFTLSERAIVVASPALLSIPVEMTMEDVLYQALVYRVAAMVVNETVEQNRAGWVSGTGEWWSLLNAIPLWAVWNSEGPLAASRQEVVRWLVHNARMPIASDRQVLPAGYETLCRTYGIWNVSPANMSIPLSCMGADQELSLTIPALPLRLDALAGVPTHFDGGSPIAGSQIVALETVLDYIVATYGRATLGRLVAALGDHADWQSLIPEVFGTSADVFQTRWHAYLAAQYTTGDPTQLPLVRSAR